MDVVSNNHEGPSQRDGTFSDVLRDDGHPDHPRQDFHFPQEVSEEHLATVDKACLEAHRMLNPKAGLRMRPGVAMEQLKKLHALLAPMFESEPAPAAQDSQPALKEILDFVWDAGEDGLAQARADSAIMRFGVMSWYMQPALFGNANQKEFGILLREEAAVRCPNCAARKKTIEAALRKPGAALHMREYCGHWVEEKFLRSLLRSIETRFVTAEMKRQSPNRVVTQMRDRFGIQNEFMRSEAARESFRRREQTKKDAQHE